MRRNQVVRLVAVLALGVTLMAGEPQGRAPEKLNLPGLDNVFRVTAELYSCGSPDTESAFAELKKLGIKSIISVDGARPNVELARKFGLRYVHVPVSYDGISRESALQLAKAVRELPRPIYVHCHHGKHRGPAGAAVAQLCLDEHCRVADALAIMKSAGTDPRYTGLFKSVDNFARPTEEELKRLPAKLPEVVEVRGLTHAMVNIDQHFDNLKSVRAAGSMTPADHPDIDPPHESLQIVESFKELLRTPETTQRPSDFRDWLTQARAAATDLEAALRNWKQTNSGKDAADKAFDTLGATCAKCHAKYRDVPK